MKMSVNDKIILSIIIVTHNNFDFLSKLLESIKNAVDFFKKTTETIIIDNGSTDGTARLIEKKFPKIKLIKNKKNLGFAVANNQGIVKARGNYLLLLNSDTILTKTVLQDMIDYLDENPQVGVVTCKVLLSDGSIDPACHRGFPTPWAAFTYFLGLERIFPYCSIFSQYHLWYKRLNTIHEIDSPTGAFFLTRKKVVDSVGLLDEKFFMYGEDIDWAFRIKQKGWKIIYNPNSYIFHLKKQSGFKGKNREIREKTITAFYDAMKIFYNKHYYRRYPILVRKLIFLIIDIKKNLELIKLNILYGFNYHYRKL